MAREKRRTSAIRLAADPTEGAPLVLSFASSEAAAAYISKHRKVGEWWYTISEPVDWKKFFEGVAAARAAKR